VFLGDRDDLALAEPALAHAPHSTDGFNYHVEEFPGSRSSAHLTRDEFLAHVLVNDHGNKITIRDVIDHAANIGGGVHHDPRPKTTAIAKVDSKVMVKGFPIGVYYLRVIAKVALRGLQPIIDDVQKRQSNARPGAFPPLPDKSGQPDFQ
jgi:hypothetical protein